MSALNRFIGERVSIDNMTYEVVGYDVAGRDVIILATQLAHPHQRTELSLSTLLKAIFGPGPHGMTSQD